MTKFADVLEDGQVRLAAWAQRCRGPGHDYYLVNLEYTEIQLARSVSANMARPGRSRLSRFCLTTLQQWLVKQVALDQARPILLAAFGGEPSDAAGRWFGRPSRCPRRVGWVELGKSRTVFLRNRLRIRRFRLSFTGMGRTRRFLSHQSRLEIRRARAEAIGFYSVGHSVCQIENPASTENS